MKTKRACIILAAGEGKRMKSALPKVLHPVCGEPMVFHPIALALGQGFEPVVLVVARQSQALRQAVEQRFGAKVRFVVQEPPRGTGHAVLSARAALRGFSGKVAILYGDVPLLAREDLQALLRAGRRSSLALLTCRLPNPKGYGRIVRSANRGIERIVEEADANTALRRIDEINAGIYLVDGPLLFRLLATLRSDNAQRELYLTDLVELVRKRGDKVQAIQRPGAESLLGVNSRAQLVRANQVMNLRLVDHWLARGVTILDPASTWLSAQVRLGKDTLIHPGCILTGQVHLGAGAELGPGAVLSGVHGGRNLRILAYSVLEDCRLGDQVVVGPFARLRPGTVLDSRCRVGNFVEIKKSHLGQGTKASHLSYLGDATLGQGVNVGAGTITCNYDGVAKHSTEIGDGVFIGSDTQFVAPVKVGKNAIIGAGTTVTHDVPEDALAVSRTPQRDIPNYRVRRHKKTRKPQG